jgi:hypothetical protein
MEGMSELKACPNCNNVGYYVVEDINGEAEQVQCQFCYTEPNSVFNAVNALNEQIRLLKEDGERLAKWVKNELEIEWSSKDTRDGMLEQHEALMKQLEVKKYTTLEEVKADFLIKLTEKITKQSALIEMLGIVLENEYYSNDLLPGGVIAKALSAYTLWKKENGK